MPDTIDALLRARAGLGDKPFLIDATARIGYAELDETSRELAAGLVSAGVTKGSRVGLIMPNGVRWAQLAFAVTRIGAVLVPLSTLLTGPELIAQLRVASVRYLIAVNIGVLVPTLCMGATFPLLVRAATAHREQAGEIVGRALSWNTIGGVG